MLFVFCSCGRSRAPVPVRPVPPSPPVAEEKAPAPPVDKPVVEKEEATKEPVEKPTLAPSKRKVQKPDPVRTLFDKALAAQGRVTVPSTVTLKDFVNQWGKSASMRSSDGVLHTWGLAIDENGNIVRKERHWDYLAMLLSYNDGTMRLQVERMEKDG